MTTSIGIDIGGTKIEIIALDDTGGTELFRKRVNTPLNYDDFIKANVDLINEAKAAVGKISHIGVGVPGIAYPDGTINIFTTFDFVKPSFAHDLSQKVNLPVAVANDANCFALSESYDGAGKDYNNVFAIIAGSGIGAGLVINKKLISGAHSITGEWGNLTLPFPKPEETTRTSKTRITGGIETNLSGPELIVEYNNLTGKNITSVKDIVTAAASGEKAALDLMDKVYDRFARMLLIPLIMIDPDIYVLGGGLSNIKDIYTKVPPLVTKYAKNIFGKDVSINLKPAEHGDSSGVRGAAWLWKMKNKD